MHRRGTDDGSRAQVLVNILQPNMAVDLNAGVGVEPTGTKTSIDHYDHQQRRTTGFAAILRQ